MYILLEFALQVFKLHVEGCDTILTSSPVKLNDMAKQWVRAARKAREGSFAPWVTATVASVPDSLDSFIAKSFDVLLDIDHVSFRFVFIFPWHFIGFTSV